jgi:putative transposase
VKGRKRHLVVDTQGLLLDLEITAANVSDTQPVLALLTRAKGQCPALELVWADQGYEGSLGAHLMNRLRIRIRLSIVRRSQYEKRGQVARRRWVVERTFAWLGRYRRLSKDYEFLPESSRAMIFAAMSCLMLRRLALSTTF